MEQQLDAMLASVEVAAEDDSEPRGKGATAGQRDSTNPGAEPAQAQGAASRQEDELASQIQQLLDEAQQQVESVAEAVQGQTDGEPDAATEGTTSAADPAEAQVESETEAKEDAETVEQAEASESPESTDSVTQGGDEEPSSIQQLDSMLAHGADQAANGVYESAAQTFSEAQASSPSAQPGIDAAKAGPGASPAPSDSAQATVDTAATAARESDKAATEPGAEPGPGQAPDIDDAISLTGFDAGSAEVAAEIDTQPEATAREPAAAASPTPVDAASIRPVNDASAPNSQQTQGLTQPQPKREAIHRSVTQAAAMLLAMLRWLLTALRRTRTPVLQSCAALNGPLQQLSPTMRQTVGYIGLLTLFNAVVLILASLIIG
jgi:hypothetical protein